MHVHLVDGTYELFRMFYGAPPATDATGREVGATRALLRSLVFLLGAPEVTHVGVAFDRVIESFRNDLFDGYKTGAGIDPALWNQSPLCERATEALGIVMWPMVEFEADDAIATAAARFAEDPHVERIVICSPDKDLAQCVRGTRIVLLDRRRSQVMNEDGVREKFGIAPGSIPDYLALVGDTADGIPGIPRWGARSAAALLAHYERIENIPDDAGEWKMKVRGADALAESLRTRRTEAALYKTLATLRTDAPLAESLEQMEWRGADRSALESLCDEIGERDLIKRITKWR